MGVGNSSAGLLQASDPICFVSRPRFDPSERGAARLGGKARPTGRGTLLLELRFFFIAGSLLAVRALLKRRLEYAAGNFGEVRLVVRKKKKKKKIVGSGVCSPRLVVGS